MPPPVTWLDITSHLGLSYHYVFVSCSTIGGVIVSGSWYNYLMSVDFLLIGIIIINTIIKLISQYLLGACHMPHTVLSIFPVLTHLIPTTVSILQMIKLRE